MLKKLICWFWGHKTRPVLHYADLYRMCDRCDFCQLVVNTDELARRGFIKLDFEPIPLDIQRKIDKVLVGVK